MADKPLLSIVVNFFNNRREAARTLHTLSCEYQQGVDESLYEVIAVDNGSSEPLSEPFVSAFGGNFKYLFHETSSMSPAGAINRAIEVSQGRYVMVLIDGAHMLTPGIVSKTLTAIKLYDNPFVVTAAFYIGPDQQGKSHMAGYNQAVEDALLEKVQWKANGYNLFLATRNFIDESCPGWFGAFSESSCFILLKSTYQGLGGLEERFESKGGGLVSLDFFRSVMLLDDIDYVVLLGEGTFHQFHGGVATSAPPDEHPWQEFHQEYIRIREQEFEPIPRSPVYFGAIKPKALPATRLSANKGIDWWLKHFSSPKRHH